MFSVLVFYFYVTKHKYYLISAKCRLISNGKCQPQHSFEYRTAFAFCNVWKQERTGRFLIHAGLIVLAGISWTRCPRNKTRIWKNHYMTTVTRKIRKYNDIMVFVVRIIYVPIETLNTCHVRNEFQAVKWFSIQRFLGAISKWRDEWVRDIMIGGWVVGVWEL